MKTKNGLRVWCSDHVGKRHLVAAATHRRALQLTGESRQMFTNYWQECDDPKWSFVTTEGYWTALLSTGDDCEDEITDADFLLESTRQLAERCDLRSLLWLLSSENQAIKVAIEAGCLEALDNIAALAPTAPEELQEALEDLWLYDERASSTPVPRDDPEEPE